MTRADGSRLVSQAFLKEYFAYHDGHLFVKKHIPKSNASIGNQCGHTDRNGYRYIRVKGYKYSEHSLVWLYFNGHYPTNYIDHINKIKTDNRIENIRDVSASENGKNRKLNNNNSSGFCGVYWRETKQMWQSQIKINNRKIHLGSFKSLEEAISMRLTAENSYNFSISHGGII